MFIAYLHGLNDRVAPLQLSSGKVFNCLRGAFLTFLDSYSQRQTKTTDHCVDSVSQILLGCHYLQPFHSTITLQIIYLPQLQREAETGLYI